jgi:hypothetical protein
VSRSEGKESLEVGSTNAGTPRWVKVSWIVAAVIVLVILAALLLGGEHGPGRHSAPRDGGRTVSVVTARSFGRW